tara:strand:+ start:42 stop:713 length:672 start_codon:yes stop_codon:yes gene_type:complete
MYKKQKILALIPARKGSKAIRNKNSKLFKKKPLISWSISSALKSKYIDEVVVSTDCAAIKKISKKYGAKVPFTRPKSLATDRSETISVVLHTLSKLEKYDYIVLLQPTSPLRKSHDIDKGIELIVNSNKFSLISFCQNVDHPDLTYKIKKNKIEKLTTDKMPRRQDAESFYTVNGAIYISNVSWLKKNKKLYDDKSVPYIMPFERSIDIDSKIDWKIAELLAK